MSTVSLQMIIKDEYEQVVKLLDKACFYFNEINLTVSDKPTANKLKKKYLGVNIDIVWREWTDKFDEARNANLEMCTSDYFFWLDADDTFDFDIIPELVDLATDKDIDAIFLPYNYAQDAQGNCVTRHWRERLLRRSKGFESRGWVHETFITDEKYTTHMVDNEVTHNSSPKHAVASAARNHSILEKAYAETKDPRYLHYLGMSYFTRAEYSKCCETLSDYLEVGGSVEDSYRALSMISEAAYHLNQHEVALEFATKAAVLKPEYPMAYWLLAQYEADQSNWNESLEWIRVSETKPDPTGLGVYDPSARERAILIAAQAEFMLQNYNPALAWLRKIPKNESAQELFESFQNEADAETFVKILPKMVKFFEDKTTLYESLCDDMKYDTRLRSLRNLATTPLKWQDDSIVIFCGQGYEEWGPHTSNKGMGGSEEAVLYLAPELVKLGYSVTVFGEVPAIDIVDGVVWRPWKTIDTRDEFNIFISWRAPQFLESIKAKKKICDVHDVLPKSIMKNYDDVTYFVKSQYHRDLYPELPDNKFVIIGNGIKKEQFNA